MSDWTEEEYSKLSGIKDLPVLEATTSNLNLINDVAESINWVTSGKVTEIKNQGSCGSDYAFAAASTVESAYAIKNNQEPLTLSAQQIIDCSSNSIYGNKGCEGGQFFYGWRYFVDYFSAQDSSYSYKGTVGVC